MPSTVSAFATAALASFILAAGAEPALARKGPKPAPCPPARYLITGGPIAANGSGTALQLGPSVALDGVCDPISPRRMQENRKGITQVLTRWKQCSGLDGTVVLQGRILPGCSQFQGTLRAKKLKKRIDAARSLCGDGLVDAGGGERCDDGNVAPGDGCEPDCTPTPPTTTTAAPVTTTSTTTPSFPTTSTLFNATTTTSPRVTTTSTTVSHTSTTTTTLPKTNLALVLVANPDPVAPNGLLTYQATVTNLGPVEAVQVQVRMPIPTGTGSCVSLSEEGQLPTGCFVTRDILWTLDRLPVGTSRTLQAVLTAANLASGTTIAATARADDAAGSPQATAQANAIVVPASPLTLGFTEDADPVRTGDTLEYVARFGNRGANALLNSQLAVTLPPGVTVLDTGGGTQASGVVTWALGPLNPGQSGERRLRVSVDDLGAADPLVRVTRAAVSSGATAARAGAVTLVQTAAPLGLTMIAGPEPVDPSQMITYELTVTNRGTADSDDVQLRMPLPEGVTGGCVRLSDDGQTPANCFTGREILWTLGTLRKGSSRSVQAIFDPIALDDGTVFSAGARVVDAAGARARAAVSSTFRTTVNAPLTVGLTESADPVLLGDGLGYLVRFGNRGMAALLNAQLVVTLPAGATVLDDGGGTVAGGTVTWALNALNAGQTGERRLRISVDDLKSDDPLVRVTRAAVTSGNVAARASTVTAIQDEPLALVMTVSPEPAGTSQFLTYELTVTNRGGTDASEVKLRMPIPDGATGGCVRLSDDAETPGNCFTGRDVLWTFDTLPAGTSRTVQAIYDVLSSAADGTILTATAAVADASGSRARTAASTTYHGTAFAPLMVALTDSANPVRIDDELRYAVRFGNRGTAALLNTQLAVTLPPGVTLVDDGGGTTDADTVAFDLGSLDPGETGERLLRVKVDDLGAADPLVRAARATVTSSTAAATASVLTMVQSSPLSLVMVANPDPLSTGQFVTYELTVTNHGPDDAFQVKITMPIPGGVGGGGCVRLSDNAETPGNCFTGRDVLWTLDTLKKGTSRTVQAIFDATTVPNGTILPAAARVEDAAESRARARVATIFHTVAASPLMVALIENSDPVLAGDELDYTIRFGNRGTGAALGAELVLTLPPGTTVIDDGGGKASGDTIRWDLGTLDAGDVGERAVRVSVDDLGAADPLVRPARAVITSGSAAASASTVTLVEPTAPLALDMAIDSDPAKPNQQVTYQLTVTNTGMDDSIQVELRMPVPSGFSACGTLSDNGTLPGLCFPGRDALWQLGTLSKGAHRTVTFVLRVTNPTPAGSILSVASRVQDAAGSRARASLSTPVEP